VNARWRPAPQILEERPGLLRESLVDPRTTDRFRVARSRVRGRAEWRTSGFTILLLVEGACSVMTGGESLRLARFDRILVPHGLGALFIEAEDEAVLLECLPPEV
jgi:mannose-6-phosphate isomerase class I